MKKFLHAHSANQETARLLDDCLEQLGDIPADATLGFLYVSDFLGEELSQILARLKQETGVQNWVGSVGLAIIGSGQEYYDQAAMSMMLADLNEADFRILPNFSLGTSEYTDELDDWCQQQAFNMGLVHADPDNPSIQLLLKQLAQTIPESFLVGGMTSSRGIHYQLADEVCHSGISGILFSDRVQALSNLTQGCTPIGSRHRVTQADNNIVFTLDQKPALEVLIDDTGEIIAKDWESAVNYIFAGLLNKNSDLNDYSVRQLIGVNEEEKIIAIGDELEDGQDLVFCRRDGNSAQEDMQRMLLQLKSRLKTAPKGGVYISCMGRGREQFGSHSEEVRLIHSVLGDFPLTGFFAEGEIHNNRLYGFTGVLTLFV